MLCVATARRVRDALMLMRFAAIGGDDVVQRAAGWLADEGKIVRRFADAPALSAHNADEQFAWVVCVAGALDDCRAATRSRRTKPAGCQDSAVNTPSESSHESTYAATRYLVIAEPSEATLYASAGVTVLTTPLRRRVVLEVLLSED